MKIFKLLLAILACAFPLMSAIAIETLQPGILKVAVTDIPKEGESAPGWTLDFLREFEQEYGLEVQFVVVPFDQSWLLASEGIVDLVATGVTVLEERRSDGASFSEPYLQVKRGLRIRAKDADRFHSVADFVGYYIGAVEGMTAHYDLMNRAPEGVNIVTFKSWDAMYSSFYQKEIDAVAEGYYVSVDTEINHNNPDYPMIDDHDLIPGHPEYLSFVIRDESEGLLDAVNQLLAKTGFPVRSEWNR